MNCKPIENNLFSRLPNSKKQDSEDSLSGEKCAYFEELVDVVSDEGVPAFLVKEGEDLKMVKTWTIHGKTVCPPDFKDFPWKEFPEGKTVIKHYYDNYPYQEKKPLLLRKINELESFRDDAYEDKLRGRISQEDFDKRDNKWTVALVELREDLQILENKNEDIYQRGVLTFELANQARNLYKQQENEEKVKFLKMVLSSAFLKDGKLQFEYKKPFDLIMKVKGNALWWR